MSTTVKRITLSLTQEDLRQLEDLKYRFGENNSQIIKRGLILLYGYNQEIGEE